MALQRCQRGNAIVGRVRVGSQTRRLQISSGVGGTDEWNLTAKFGTDDRCVPACSSPVGRRGG